MPTSLTAVAARSRVLVTRGLSRMGLGGDSFLTIVAVCIGLVTAAAAVAFHEMILQTRDLLYERFGAQRLYGAWLPMLVVWPALGGVTVGVVSRYVFRTREGHGVVDVMESVIRSSGFIRPLAAVEKIITSAITIGSGGSAGAEGPIVQIGAAIASGLGQAFRLTRQQMPVMIGCGAAAGVSAIFNSPMGGLLFALEVILQDFSVRNVTALVIASVVANVGTHAIFRSFMGRPYGAIFDLTGTPVTFNLDWVQVVDYALLGVACGVVGVAVTRLMYWSERKLAALPGPQALRPGLGGAMLGLLGVAYVLVLGRWFGHVNKPIPFDVYPMPAFFGDGYGFIQRLLGPGFYGHGHAGYVVALLLVLLVAKIAGTCLTLSSGGSGGIIAPSVFLGAVTGGAMGMLMRAAPFLHGLRPQPEAYALVGMGAVLAAVVHAPLASILILMELTNNPDVVLPAMLAAITATGVARLLFADSVYTLSLRRRGIRLGADSTLLHRLTVEQVDLSPAVILREDDPFQCVLDLMGQVGASDFVVVDEAGCYGGMVVAEDIKTALLEREAVPLLLVEEMMRADVVPVKTTDDLAGTMDAFARHDVSHLPVVLPGAPGKVVGLVSRSALMRRYQKALGGGAY